jgi:hypothetical protein
MVGGGTKVKPVFVAVPAGVVTATLPEAPNPTVARMEVAESTKKYCAEESPNLTAVAPVRLVPVIVIWLEVPPLAGVNDVIVGA